MDRTFPLKRSANSGGYAGVYKHGNGWRVLIKDGDKLKQRFPSLKALSCTSCGSDSVGFSS